MFKKILITGGAGFIGSALVRFLIRQGVEVINLDKLTYAGHLSSLTEVKENYLHHFYTIDICDSLAVRTILEKHQPEAIMHLAAESHVDKSINCASEFIQTNIVGSYVLLDEALRYWKKNKSNPSFRFHHVSTDEVYGTLDEKGYFNERSPYQPNSPYSASKASSDFLVRAWGKTFGFPYVISNCSNNYGPFQLPEKLIPITIIRAIKGLSLNLYGDGMQIRDWLFVDDHVSALWRILNHGQNAETYLVGRSQEKTNKEVVETICQILDEIHPVEKKSYLQQIRLVQDRPGHDRRYAIDASKLKHELDWQPDTDFETGIQKTVCWYLNNPDWWQEILNRNFSLERQGVELS